MNFSSLSWMWFGYSNDLWVFRFFLCVYINTKCIYSDNFHFVLLPTLPTSPPSFSISIREFNGFSVSNQNNNRHRHTNDREDSAHMQWNRGQSTMLKNIESMLHGCFLIQRFFCICLFVLSVAFVVFYALDALDKITTKCLMKWKDISQQKEQYQTICVIGAQTESSQVEQFLISFVFARP